MGVSFCRHLGSLHFAGILECFILRAFWSSFWNAASSGLLGNFDSCHLAGILQFFLDILSWASWSSSCNLPSCRHLEVLIGSLHIAGISLFFLNSSHCSFHLAGILGPSWNCSSCRHLQFLLGILHLAGILRFYLECLSLQAYWSS